MKRLILALCLLAGPAFANDWDALEQPGAVAIMRHALAPGTGDPANLTVGDCSTQRNLDARGRAQAQAIGQAFRDRGYSFDRVLTSQWCRCRDTADLLALGPVEEVPALNSFFRDRSTRAEQTAATRAILDNTDGRLFLVTHFVNIAALTGESVSSGEVLVIRPGPDGVEVLGSILIEP